MKKSRADDPPADTIEQTRKEEDHEQNFRFKEEYI
jgi:hypothetical protein